MDKQSIKEILLRYPPGNDAEVEPELAAARREAEKDPELQEWFAQQQKFQTAMRRAMRQIQPPASLKARILAGRPASRKILWWQSPQWLAAAAAFVLLASLVAFWLAPSRKPGYAAYRDRMAKFASREYRMDILATNSAQIRAYLAGKQSPADYVVPRELEPMPLAGCAALKWRNQPVSLICFRRGKDDLLWLFVISQSAVPSAPSGQAPQFEQINKLALATWSQQGKTYTLAAFGDRVLLQRYLE